ncbi:MAG: ABC transporter ATP-binding protein [Verrucomicrobiota bacterium]
MSENGPVLEARGLKKSFQLPGSRLKVLRGFDFALDAGVSASIRGESGSGKSTLLNLFAGLERADEGEILWDGVSIRSLDARRLARVRALRMGLVFQAYHLVGEMTALENVLLAARISGKLDGELKERGRALLDRVGLGGRERQLPSQMSGGERQRVAVARAILNSPRVLFADEPTGNLDEKTGKETMELLFALVSEERVSLVLVTHNPAFAEACDQQWLLSEGILRPRGR